MEAIKDNLQSLLTTGRFIHLRVEDDEESDNKWGVIAKDLIIWADGGYDYIDSFDDKLEVKEEEGSPTFYIDRIAEAKSFNQVKSTGGTTVWQKPIKIKPNDKVEALRKEFYELKKQIDRITEILNEI